MGPGPLSSDQNARKSRTVTCLLVICADSINRSGNGLLPSGATKISEALTGLTGLAHLNIW